MRERGGPRPRDVALGALADRQHGVVSWWQLLAIRFTRSAISRLVAAGQLGRLHPGVYAVGHEHLRAEGRLMAAVLAVGPGAVLSHKSAAELHGLVRTASPRVHVTTTARGRKSTKKVRVHRNLHPLDAREERGIGVTTPARTLLDLAETEPTRTLERALDQAEVLRLFDSNQIQATLRRSPGRRGTAKLTATLEVHEPGSTFTRSELEERFLALCRDHGLPQPQVNARSDREVDFTWPGHSLVVETDGRTYHATRQGFQRDRERNRAHTLAGRRPVAFTWRDIVHDSEHAARAVAALRGCPLE
ncbi:MAG TPA: type IV toxin-antitoxin system AbiEi family antitoxin domain-containing protein [Solirubrobacteraceae bacterium]